MAGHRRGPSTLQGEKTKIVKAKKQVGGELVDSLLGCSHFFFEASAWPSTERCDGAAICPSVRALSTSRVS